jgi:hypothetical protein
LFRSPEQSPSKELHSEDPASSRDAFETANSCDEFSGSQNHSAGENREVLNADENLADGYNAEASLDLKGNEEDEAVVYDHDDQDQDDQGQEVDQDQDKDQEHQHDEEDEDQVNPFSPVKLHLTLKTRYSEHPKTRLVWYLNGPFES